MSTPSLNAEEIIAELRLIADCMAVRGCRPGYFSKSLTNRVHKLTRKAGMPLFGLWANHRKYNTEPTTIDFDGRPAQIRVIKTDDTHRDDEIAEICQAITECLMLVDWKRLVDSEITPMFHDWTPEIAEAAICKAAEQLPNLCDRLEEKSGPKTDQKRTASKKVARKKAWTSDCGRMKNEWFKECRKLKKRVSRIGFIRRELRANASRYPSAETASTIDKRFQDNPTEWATELDALLQKSGLKTDQ